MLSNSAPSLALAELGKGEHATLVALDSAKCIWGRLTCLGFTPGVDIHVLQNYGHGPLVVTVRGTRIALGRGEACKITVRRSDA